MAFLLAFVMSAAPAQEIVMLRHSTVSRAQAARLLRAREPVGSDGAVGVLRLGAAGQTRLISSTALARLAGLPPPVRRRDFAFAYRPSRRPLPCIVAARAISRHMTVDAGDVVPGPCDGAAAGVLAYDRRSHAVVAMADLPPHVRLGHWRIARRPPVGAGDVVTLRSSVGPVVIERQVTALQPGDAGRPVFVRGVAGPAFAIPVAPAAK